MEQALMREGGGGYRLIGLALEAPPLKTPLILPALFTFILFFLAQILTELEQFEDIRNL